MTSAPPVRGLLLDAAGTLLLPAEPVALTYWRAATAVGPCRPREEIEQRFGDAFRRHRGRRREDGQWLAFWSAVVAQTTGIDDLGLVQRLWEHFARAPAWTVAPGAESCCRAIGRAGLRIGIVSNWDLRLRPLLDELGVLDWVDRVLVSAEEGIEKPDARIFELACRRLGVAPAEAIMVGDSRDEDVAAARRAGCQALLFGEDVKDFADLAAVLVSDDRPVVPG